MTMRLSRIALALVAAAGLVLATGCGGRAVVPTSYSTHNCKDGTFKVQYPAQWQAESGGKAGYAWAKFTSGNAEVSVETGLTGSLLGDISATGLLPHPDGATDEKLPPVAAVHLLEKKSFEADAGVQEKEPTTVTTSFGEGRKSEFRGTNSFGAESRGYRATTLARDYRIRVVCKCPVAEWDALKPAFDKIIESLAAGKPEP
jgi:hypothetical protein